MAGSLQDLDVRTGAVRPPLWAEEGLSSYRMPIFPDVWFLYIFAGRRRRRTLVLCPHYRCLRYICDQPGACAGLFVWLVHALGQPSCVRRDVLAIKVDNLRRPA